VAVDREDLVDAAALIDGVHHVDVFAGPAGQQVDLDDPVVDTDSGRRRLPPTW